MIGKICLIILFIYIIIITIYRVKYPWLMPKSVKENLYTGMGNVHTVLEKNNIPYFAICGTLLGAVRHGEIIPWDDDIDIGILEEDVDRFNSIDFGYESFPVGAGGCGKIFIDKNKKSYIDVFPFRKVENKYEYIEVKARTMWPKEYFIEGEIYPLKQYKLGNIVVNGPNKFSQYCSRAWGKDWKTPSMKLGKKIIYPEIAIRMIFQKYNIKDN
jgi:phosphorylcholine metabolism protein LicD